MKYSLLFSILVLFLVAGPALAELEVDTTRPTPPPEEHRIPFLMPTPEGWKTETIPFPLGFAPELAYEGFEELRFAPGMFKTDQEDFWTYAFVWWIPDSTEINADILTTDLNAYYRGLAAAVGEGKVDMSEIPETHSVVQAVEAAEDGPIKFEGTIDTFDSFASLTAITLNFRAEVIPCGTADRLGVFFELSPQPTTHEVWQTLHDIRKGFQCEF